MNIPDEIDPAKEDQNIEQIRKENQGEEEKDKEEPKRGKCACLII